MAHFYLLPSARQTSSGQSFSKSTFSVACFLLFVIQLFPGHIQAQNTLDNVGLSTTQPSAAFSLRKLSSTYAGPAIEVRRSSDNTFLTIGFDASGNLDTATLKTFVGAGSGFIKTWYDQSGYGKNAAQATNAAQPRIMLNGVIDRANNYPAITWQNKTQLLTGASTDFQTLNAVRNLVGNVNDYQTLFATPASGDVPSLRRNYGEKNASGVSTPNVNDWMYNSAITDTLLLPNYVNGIRTLTGVNTLHTVTSVAKSILTNTFSISSTNASRGMSAGNAVSEIITLASVLNNNDRATLECNQASYYAIVRSNIIPNQTATTCSGTAIALAPGAVSYTWSAPVISPAGAVTGGTDQIAITSTINQTLTNNTIANGTATYTVTPYVCGVAGAAFTLTVTVTPTVSLPTQNITACNAVAFAGTPSGVPAGTTYSWPVPVISPAAAISGGAAGNNLASISQTLTNNTTAVATATYTITPKTGTCVGTPYQLVVTVNPKGTLTSTQTPAAICSGTNFTYTPTANYAGATFTWTRAAVAGIAEAAITTPQSLNPNEVLTNTTLAPINVKYNYVITANGCSDAAVVTVAVNPVPVVANYNFSACSGTGFNASPSGVPSGTKYSWSLPTISPAGAITGAGTGALATSFSQTLTNTLFTDATATYIVTPNYGGCNGASFTVTVTVGGKMVPVNRNIARCSGSEIYFVPPPAWFPDGTTLSWTLPTGSGFSGATAETGQTEFYQILTNNTSANVVATYTITATSGSCTKTFILKDTVWALPSVKTITAARPDVCYNNSTDVVITNSDPGYYYQLYDQSNNSIDTAVVGTGGTIYLNTGNLTTATTFHVIATNPATDCNSLMDGTPTIGVNTNPVPVVTLVANYCLGDGKVEIITGEPHDSYIWSNNVLTPKDTVIQSGIYSVTVTDANTGTCKSTASISIGDELIENGNFSSGPYLFNSELLMNSNLQVESRWFITPDAHQNHNNFWGRDHSTGNGKFMAINGGSNPATKLWYKNNIPVQPNTLYYFSAWGLSLNNVQPFAKLVFNINDVQVGTTAVLAPGINSLTGNTGWTRFYGQYFSGSNTSVNLSIVNLNTSTGGNDFGLDDISFSTLPPVSLSVTARDSVICMQDNFVMPVTQAGGISPLTYTWTGPNGFTSSAAAPVFDDVSHAITGLYTVKIKDGRGCESKLDSAYITVRDSAAITTQPVETTFCPAGGSASFSVAATGYNANYQWQVSTNNGTSFANVGGGTTGGTTPTLTITAPTATMNGYLYRVLVNAPTPCALTSKISDAKPLYLKNTWLGKISADWNDAANWSGGVLPSKTACTSFYILGSVPNQPVISSGTVDVNNIVIYSGATLVVRDAKLQVSGAITNSGVFDVTNGTLEMTGTTQAMAGSMFKDRTIKNLIVSGGQLNIATTANDTLNITGTLSFGQSTSKINTGGNITLKSTAAGTANVAVVPAAGSITGSVISERYINTGTAAGQHGKAWQFVAANVAAGVKIKDSWMETYNAPTGYGTWITDATGTANGFDASSVSPTMKYYNAAGDNYIGVANPATTDVKNAYGYMLYVRGDRNVKNLSTPAAATVLRAKGALITGTQTAIAVPAGKFQSIGNPYASAVDFKAITKTGIADAFYVWDPTLLGSYSSGGYQTITASTGYLATPGGGSIYNMIGRKYDTIQSGQAFLVKNAAGGGTVQFTEAAKVNGSNLVNRGGNYITNGSGVSMLSTMLFTANGILADGNRVVFGAGYSNDVNADDALKITNGGENFGLIRNETALAVETKDNLKVTDTIFYRMSTLAQQTYQLAFAPENINAANLQAQLVDKFTGSRTSVSLSDSTIIAFSITADAASKAADRFMMVFKPLAGPLSVNITSIAASRNADRSIAITWKTQSEINIQQYDVQRSADGRNFTGIITAAPTAVNGGSAMYVKNDLSPLAADNYYRIKATSIGGQIQYSATVKVAPAKAAATIGVFPNPVTDKNVQIQFSNTVAGAYRIQLTNKIGQVVYNGTAEVTGNVFVKSIHLDANASGGIYQLRVIDEQGTGTTQQVIVQ